MKKYCPKCRVLNDELSSKCSNCGYDFFKIPKIVSYYEPSSATVYTTSFNTLVQKFDNPDNKKTRSELLDDKLKDDDLRSFVDWGYLICHGGQYSLTERGKEAYFISPEYKKRKSKDEEKDE